jgi:FimV-like protein
LQLILNVFLEHLPRARQRRFFLVRVAFAAPLALLLALLSSHLLAADAVPEPVTLRENEAQALEGGAADRIAQLENALIASAANLARVRIDNRELSQRVDLLDGQVAHLDDAITAQSERLAQLQADFAARDATAAEQVSLLEAQAAGLNAALKAQSERLAQLQADLAARDAAAERGVLSRQNVALVLGVAGLIVGGLGCVFALSARRRVMRAAEIKRLPATEPLDRVAAAPAQSRFAKKREVISDERSDDDSSGIDGEDGLDNKIDLATAYMAMGKRAAALELLQSVLASGNAQQQQEARRLKDRWQG